MAADDSPSPAPRERAGVRAFRLAECQWREPYLVLEAVLLRTLAGARALLRVELPYFALTVKPLFKSVEPL